MKYVVLSLLLLTSMSLNASGMSDAEQKKMAADFQAKSEQLKALLQGKQAKQNEIAQQLAAVIKSQQPEN